MSRSINRLCGRVFAWFDSKDSRESNCFLPSKFDRRARLALQTLEDRTVPAIFTVTNLGDNNGVNPTVGAGTGTLRQAIVDANASAGADTIVFNADNDPGEVNFATSRNVLFLFAALPTTSAAAGQSLTIEGPGADKLVIAPGLTTAYRFISVGGGSNTFELRDVYLSNFSGNSTGGTINVASTSNLILNRVHITGSRSGAGSGGALYLNNGQHQIHNSTLSFNSSSNAATGGGAIRLLGTTATNTMTITNSTFFANTSGASGGAIGFGGWVGTFNLNNSTIVGNVSPSATTTDGLGGALSRHSTSTSATLNINSTIIAGNSANNNRPDISLIAGGLTVNVTKSLIGVADSGFAFTTDVDNKKGTLVSPLNPEVSALGFQGGPMPVLVPLGAGSGSLALGNGLNSASGKDQNGVTRNSPFDIGSVEVESPDKPFAIIQGKHLPNIFAGDPTPYTFEVTFYDDDGLDVSTLDDGDEFLVTGPNGFSTLASFVDFIPSGPSTDGTPRTVLYQFNAPGGNWDPNDNGVYSIELVANQVKDINGVAADAQFEGGFVVVLAAPTVAADVIPNISLLGSGPDYVFSVKYTDISGGSGIKYASLGDTDIQVSGFGIPPGTFATFVSSDKGVGVDATPIIATYKFTAPGGTWDAPENGQIYTLTMKANEVTNTVGTPVPSGVIGTFYVSFPTEFVVTVAGDNAGGINPLPGAGTGTLRQAIVDANHFPDSIDTITFSALFNTPQTINLLGPLPTLPNSIEIIGKGASKTTIQRDGSVGTNFSIFTINKTTGVGTLSMSGLTIVGNGSTAIVGTTDDALNLDQIVVSGVSTTSAGGAINIGTGGALTLTNSTLNANTTTSTGGGIHAAAGTTVTIDKSTISNNIATGAGGGINFLNSATGQNLIVTNSTISGNVSKTTTANYGGGGISFPGSTGTGGFLVRNSTISGNSAAGSGGGIVFRALNGNINTTVHIQNSTITNNTANSGSLTEGQGGGGIALSTIGATPPILDIESSIISGNTASGANTFDDLSVIATATVEATFSAIGDDDGYTLGGASGDNLSFVDAAIGSLNLAVLGFYNGGTTKTHNLNAGSTALEKGSNPSNVTPALTKDQNGNPRVQPIGVGIIDIGAVERVPGEPAASIDSLPNVSKDLAGTNNPYVFTVTYTDDVLMNISTIGNAPDDDIQISKVGGGFSAIATFVSADKAVNSPVVVTTYKFTPPGGTWDSVDNGNYEVILLADTVKNTANVSVPAGTLGSFNVNAAAPAATATTTAVSKDDASTNPYKFTVTFTDANAIDASTIFGNDSAIRVVKSGGGFDVPATFVSIDINSNGTPRTATYQITPPVNDKAGWDTSDNGTYQIAMQPSQVKNLQGTFVPAGNIGSFLVAIGGTLIVENTNNVGPGSLRAAIETANAAPGIDTIIFSSLFNTPQTISISSEIPINEAVIISGPGASKVTVDAGGGSRIFNTSGAPAGDVITISDMTLTNGSVASNGGGILVTDEALVLERMVIINNKATSGTTSGGGIHVAAAAASLTIRNSTIADNSSPGGGGVVIGASAKLLVENCTFVGNHTNGGNTGGAIRYTATVPTDGYVVRNSTFFNNKSNFSGGAIGFSVLGGTALIESCTIVNNVAEFDAGTTGAGGGIGTNTGSTGTLNLLNCIVSDNILGGGSAGGKDINLFGTVTFNCNTTAIGENKGFSISSGSGNLFGVDLKLAPGLADNGGPTLTLLPDADSPVVDAGPATSSLTTDQRGIGFARVVNGKIDLGAVERQSAAPVFDSLSINSGNAQRSRITTIDVTFTGSVDAANFQTSGLVTLTRLAATMTLGSDGFNGIAGFIVNTGNGLQVTQNGTNTLRLSFTDIVNNGVENTSLADGRWQLAITPASFTSSDSNPSQAIRRLFGDFDGNGTTDGSDIGFLGFGTNNPPFDIDNNGTIDGGDFSALGGRFGVTI